MASVYALPGGRSSGPMQAAGAFSAQRSAGHWGLLGNQTVRAARAGMLQWAHAVVQDIKKSMSTQTGPRGPGSPNYEPPFRRTGELKNSIGYGVEQLVAGGGFGTLQVLIGSGVSPGGAKADPGYAAAVEFGTFKMAPRPYLRPAIRDDLGMMPGKIMGAMIAAQAGWV